MNKFKLALDNYFEISKRGSKFSTEIIAGLTTFLAMAYILVVNPNQIVGAGSSQWNSVFIATAIGAIIGTVLMGVLAKLPIAQAPGMGLNSQTFLLIAGFSTGGLAYGFSGAMAVVLISGVLFLLLSVFGLREKIFTGIPTAIRAAIPVGIGLFIAFIGFQGANIIMSNQFTQVSFVNLTYLFKGFDTPLDDYLKVIFLSKGFPLDALPTMGMLAMNAVVALFGLIVIAVLQKFKVKGGVLIGIVAATLLGIPCGVTNLAGLSEGWNVVERFAHYFSFKEETGAFGMFAFGFAKIFQPEYIITTIMMVIVFCMIDMFDTIGTLFGCATKANLVNEKGEVLNFKKAMYADSIATVAGACLGTSTVTSFVESGAGVAAGGKTGLTAVVTAIMFFIAIFISPLLSIIPSAATAPALIYVGVLMMGTVTKIDFTDIRIAVPAFLTIVMMPLTYSITDGIGIGMVSYVIINIVCYFVDLIVYSVKNKRSSQTVTESDGQQDSLMEKTEKPKWTISVVTGIIAVLFLIKFLVPTSF